MDLFKKLGNLTAYLDDELHQIEASLQAATASSLRYDGPSEKSVEIHDEIQELGVKIDDLIKLAENQHQHFEGFIVGMTDTLAEYDEKFEKIEKHAANYGYQIPEKKEIDLRASLEQVENLKIEQKLVVDSPNLLQAGISKKTLKSLGYNVKVDKEEIVEEKTETESENDESLLEDSPIFSILKKPKSNPNASIVNHSRVEISPGLFVKRPSSKTKKVEQEVTNFEIPSLGNKKSLYEKTDELSPQIPILNDQEANLVLSGKKKNPRKTVEEKKSFNLDDSPEMPSLKTMNLTKVLRVKNVEEDKEETPELPVMKSEEGQLLLSMKKVQKENILSPDTSPTLPVLNDFQASLMLSGKKSKTPLKKNEPIFDSPEAPNLKTVNLAKLLREASGTDL